MTTHAMRRAMLPVTLAIALPALLLLRSDIQTNAQSAPQIDAAIRQAVIGHTIEALATTYVEADAGRQIGADLQRSLDTGTYDPLDNPSQFANAVTRDMRRLNGDLHLSLQYTPTGSAPAAFGGQADPASMNFGMGKAEILAGNIGYIEITGFMGAPGYEDAVVNALRFIDGTRAVIIDVRRNGGGSSGMSHFVFSHFLGADPVPTINVRRRNGPPVQRQSLGPVPGPRRPDVPLYILTSQGTASAAEEFTFVLRNLNRATIVGSRTAGAGRMVTRVPVGHGFSAGISITQVTDPASGREWEGVGVQPHVDVPPAQALDAAHEAALLKLQPPGSDASTDRLVAMLQARRHPAIPSGDLAQWAGGYEGRVITVNRDGLWYERRAGALPERLVPLAPDRFALGTTEFVFEVRENTRWLTLTQPNGTRLTLRQN